MILESTDLTWEKKKVGGKHWAKFSPQVTGASQIVGADKQAKCGGESLPLWNLTGNANGIIDAKMQRHLISNRGTGFIELIIQYVSKRNSFKTKKSSVCVTTQ
jgi:hypothetical protein